jgi:CheY-like chemotaxis protein
MWLSTPQRDRSRDAGRSPVLSVPLRILVVDDDALIRSLFAACLPPQGFAVWLAASGAEAIELFREHGGDFDILLLDVRMPGLNGPQTLALLRQLDSNVRCCFMSGDTGDYTEDDLFTLGAVAVVDKPFSLNALVRQLRELVAGQPV